MAFFDNNYFDMSNYSFVFDKGNLDVPIGMHYIEFTEMPGLKYILGVINNNIDKKTIVAALGYVDDYLLFNDQKEFITYISTVEVNRYFRNMGLCKELIDRASLLFININQNILISELSEMGRLSHVDKIFVNTLTSYGFDKDFRSDNYNFDVRKYHEFIRKDKHKVKKLK